VDFESYLRQPLEFSKEIARYFDDRAPLVIFDVGACEGEDTIRLKRRFPNACIYAFEPLPENATKVQQNLETYRVSDVEVFQLALSDRPGRTEFYVSSGHPDHIPRTEDWDYGNKSSSLLPPKEHTMLSPWVQFDRTIHVQTQRIDFFCDKHSIDRIDLMYLDVQGAEIMVLRGAGDYVKRTGAIWMEVGAIELYEGQPLKNDVQRFMNGCGFVCIKDTVNKTAGDQLYINRELMTWSDILRGYTARRGRYLKWRLMALRARLTRTRSQDLTACD
jgi:FkbM family methyltransferase